MLPLASRNSSRASSPPPAGESVSSVAELTGKLARVRLAQLIKLPRSLSQPPSAEPYPTPPFCTPSGESFVDLSRINGRDLVDYLQQIKCNTLVLSSAKDISPLTRLLARPVLLELPASTYHLKLHLRGKCIEIFCHRCPDLSLGNLLAVTQKTLFDSPCYIGITPPSFRYLGTFFLFRLLLQLTHVQPDQPLPPLDQLKKLVSSYNLVMKEEDVDELYAGLTTLPPHLRFFFLHGLELNRGITPFYESKPLESLIRDHASAFSSLKAHASHQERSSDPIWLSRSRGSSAPYPENAYPCAHFTNQLPYCFELFVVGERDAPIKAYTRHEVLKVISKEKVTVVIPIGSYHTTTPPWGVLEGNTFRRSEDGELVHVLSVIDPSNQRAYNQALEEALLLQKGGKILTVTLTHPPYFFNASLLPSGHIITPHPMGFKEVINKFSTMADFRQMIMESAPKAIIQIGQMSTSPWDEEEGGRIHVGDYSCRHFMLDNLEDFEELSGVIIKLSRLEQEGPIVVTCPTGGSSSGTFVAADLITRFYQFRENQLEAQWSLNLPKLVERLVHPPYGRFDSVSNFEDYELLHQYTLYLSSLDFSKQEVKQTALVEPA